MSDTSKHDEPTMEEILASIRKIIAEDDPKDESHKENINQDRAMTKGEEEDTLPPLVTTEAMVMTTTTPTTPESDVLELTESMVTEDHPKPADEPTHSDKTIHPDKPGHSVDVHLDVETTSPRPSSPTTSTGAEELLSETVKQQTSSAFADLNQALKETRKNAPPPQPTSSIPLGASGQTLEAIIREMLKPMLQDWVNANLPQMVEHMIKQEIDKIMQRY